MAMEQGILLGDPERHGDKSDGGSEAKGSKQGSSGEDRTVDYMSSERRGEDEQPECELGRGRLLNVMEIDIDLEALD
jgi:hypothetical protein